jgi:hypothetical protein
MQNLPSFFKDESGTLKVEEVIDYFLSWTIRSADVKYQEVDLVNKYSKMLLSKLIFDDEIYLRDKSILNIKTWKQHQNIDLWIELEIENQKYGLIIENKMYSSIRENQLSKYAEIAKKHYSDKTDYILKFIFIRPDYEHDRKYNEKVSCTEQGYCYYNLAELQELLPGIKTGNDLFDEFWFNW